MSLFIKCLRDRYMSIQPSAGPRNDRGLLRRIRFTRLKSLSSESNCCEVPICARSRFGSTYCDHSSDKLYIVYLAELNGYTTWLC